MFTIKGRLLWCLLYFVVLMCLIFADCFVKVAKNEGFLALWSGLLSSLVLVTNPAINFMIYEALKRNILPVLHNFVRFHLWNFLLKSSTDTDTLISISGCLYVICTSQSLLNTFDEIFQTTNGLSGHSKINKSGCFCYASVTDIMEYLLDPETKYYLCLFFWWMCEVVL